MSPQPPDVVDLQHCNDAITVWNEQEWISTGKKYPASDVPNVVQKAQSNVLTVPPEYAAFLPDQHLSITEFLQKSLPAQASVLISQTGSSSFSDELPNEDPACLAVRSIPPKAWILALEKASGQI